VTQAKKSDFSKYKGLCKWQLATQTLSGPALYPDAVMHAPHDKPSCAKSKVPHSVHLSYEHFMQSALIEVQRTHLESDIL